MGSFEYTSVWIEAHKKEPRLFATFQILDFCSLLQGKLYDIVYKKEIKQATMFTEIEPVIQFCYNFKN